MEPKHTILCSVCGQHASEDAHFCERCGARLAPLPGGSFRPTQPVAAARDPRRRDKG